MNNPDDTLRSDAMPPRAMDRGLDGEAMRRRIASRLFGEPAEPVRIDRFRVVGKLGAGGMGVVLSAVDEDLERPVAIKILANERMRSDSAEHARLVREARALAKLSHPNVVQVYEVGEYEGGVFIAMELVRGTNLRQWLAAARRPLPAILERFLAAAHGLAAAHRVGVVHRDFKPSNALVGEDGRVRIADFGLARGPLTTSPLREPAQVPPSLNSTTDASAVGTPAYMSPEQLRGDEVDARSDQFSFCVALYEAVFGHRPEVTRTASTTRGGDETRTVPRWLRRLLARGLALHPEDRHASMAAVIDALQAGPRRRRTRLRAAGLFVAITASVAVGGALTRQPPRDLCPDPQAQLEHVWDGEQRQAVRAAFTASALDYAPATHTRVERALDSYAARWTAASRDACEATWIRGDQSPELLGDSVRCLGSARAALSSRVRVLATADPAIVADADTIVAGLPSPEQCRDARALVMQQHRERTMLPETAADLDRARVHFQIRQGREAITLLQDLLARLHTANDTVGEAEALLLLGKTQARVLREPASATHSLDQAFDRATAAQRHELTWEIWTEQAWIRAVELDEAGEARRLLGHASSALQSLHTTDPLPQAALHAVEASILELEERPDEAVQLRRTIVDTMRRNLVAAHPDLLEAQQALASTLGRAGRLDEAITLRQQLVAELGSHHGVAHPLTARCELDLGQDLFESGDRALARKHAEHARAVLTATYGHTSPIIANAEILLAQLDAADGAYDLAIPRAEAALAIYDDTLPRGHLNRVATLTVLLNCYVYQASHDGNYAQIVERASELLAIQDATTRDVVDIPAVLIAIGESLCSLGRCGEALPYYQRLAVLYQQQPPDEPAMQAFPLRGIGLAHLAADRPALALPFLEEAYELLRTLPRERDGLTETLAATARDLARALEATQHSPARVRSLRRLADSLGARPPV